MDDLFWKCLFEAERIVKVQDARVDAVPSKIGSIYYKNLYYKSRFLPKSRVIRCSWFSDDREPSFNKNYIIQKIAEDLDYLFRYGKFIEEGVENK